MPELTFLDRQVLKGAVLSCERKNLIEWDECCSITSFFSLLKESANGFLSVVMATCWGH